MPLLWNIYNMFFPFFVSWKMTNATETEIIFWKFWFHLHHLEWDVVAQRKLIFMGWGNNFGCTNFGREGDKLLLIILPKFVPYLNILAIFDQMSAEVCPPSIPNMVKFAPSYFAEVCTPCQRLSKSFLLKFVLPKLFP